MGKYLNKDGLQEYTTQLTDKYKDIFATKTDVGSPLIASTISQMTNTNKVYVYTGSESGYTYGNWYYYNGSSWVSGGIYNSAIDSQNIKNDIDNCELRLENLDGIVAMAEFSYGNITMSNNTFVFNDVSSAYFSIKTKESVYLKAGTILYFSDINTYKYYVAYMNNGSATTQYLNEHDETSWTVVADNDFYFQIQTKSVTPIQTISDATSTLSISIPQYLKKTVNELITEAADHEQRISALETDSIYNQRLQKILITNIVPSNAITAGYFSASNGTSSVENDWVKFTPSGTTTYGSIGFNTNAISIDAGDYLVCAEIKLGANMTNIKNISVRFASSGSPVNTFSYLNKNTQYDCRYINGFVTATSGTYKIFNLYITAKNGNLTSNDVIYVRNFNVIKADVFGEDPEKSWYYANAIYGQHNGFINGKKLLDMQFADDYPMAGHNIALFGDSILGNYSIGSRLSKKLLANVSNCAVGGETAIYGQSAGGWSTSSPLTLYKISEAIKTGDWTDQIATDNAKATTMSQLNYNTLDSIIILIGTNDWRRSPLIGNNDSTASNEFKGALNSIISNILTTYPTIRIYLMSPLYRTEFGDTDTVPNSGGQYLYEFASAIGDIAKKWHIPFYDCYNKLGINVLTGGMYLTDGTHPASNTEILIANIISKMLIDYIC